VSTLGVAESQAENFARSAYLHLFLACNLSEEEEGFEQKLIFHKRQYLYFCNLALTTIPIQRILDIFVICNAGEIEKDIQRNKEAGKEDCKEGSKESKDYDKT